MNLHILMVTITLHFVWINLVCTSVGPTACTVKSAIDAQVQLFWLHAKISFGATKVMQLLFQQRLKCLDILLISTYCLCNCVYVCGFIA